MASPLNHTREEVEILTDVYLQHPVRQRSVANNIDRARIRACRLYMGDVEYGITTRSVFFYNDSSTGQKWLSCLIRMDELCNCGCHGRCTYFVVHIVMQYFFNAGAVGEHPPLRHDRTPHHEQSRIDKAGSVLGVVLPVTEIRADWPALCTPCGFRSWSHNVHPCNICDTPKRLLGSLAGVTCEGGFWEEWTEEDRRMEVSRRTHAVFVDSRALQQAISSNLHFDSEKARGRAIKATPPGTILHPALLNKLIPRDRLAPTYNAPDVHRCTPRILKHAHFQNTVVNTCPHPFPGFRGVRIHVGLPSPQLFPSAARHRYLASHVTGICVKIISKFYIACPPEQPLPAHHDPTPPINRPSPFPPPPVDKKGRAGLRKCRPVFSICSGTEREELASASVGGLFHMRSGITYKLEVMHENESERQREWEGVDVDIDHYVACNGGCN